MKKRKSAYFLLLQIIIISILFLKIILNNNSNNLNDWHQYSNIKNKSFDLNTLNSGWSNVTVISDIYGWNDGFSILPSIALDNDGNLQVVWGDDTNGTWGIDTEIMYSNCSEIGWSNATVISDDYTGWNNGASQYSSITTDNNGNLHVVWEDFTEGEWGTDVEIMYTKYDGMNWSNATIISDDYTGWNDGDSDNPRIVMDNNNNIHVVWCDMTWGEWGSDTEIMYANYTVMGWSNATVISDDANLWNDGGSYDPSIAIDKNGNLHVVWGDETVGEWGNDYEVMYVNYTAGIWSNATVISDDITGWNNGNSGMPDIAADNNGNLYVVWQDNTNGTWGIDREIMYAEYTAAGWSNATIISDDITGWNNGGSYVPSITVDEYGNIHVVWLDYTNGTWGTDAEIMYTTRNDFGWSDPTIISDDFTSWNDGESMFPRITADKSGKIHVVWLDETNGTWGTDMEIMYSSKSIIITDGIINHLPFISQKEDNYIIFLIIISSIAVGSIIISTVIIQRRTSKKKSKKITKTKFKKGTKLSASEIRKILKDSKERSGIEPISLEDIKNLIKKPLVLISRELYIRVQYLKNLTEKQKGLLLEDLASLDNEQREEWIRELEELEE